MPLAPLRHCSPGCPTLTRGGPCAVHTTPKSTGWNNDDTRLRGRRLQAKRKQLFDDEPLCRLCRKLGRVSAATIRDHIVPLAEGGTDEDSNIQPLCQTCSDTKTRQEAIRGRNR